MGEKNCSQENLKYFRVMDLRVGFLGWEVTVHRLGPLSPLRGLVLRFISPEACASGYIMSPRWGLRGEDIIDSPVGSCGDEANAGRWRGQGN